MIHCYTLYVYVLQPEFRCGRVLHCAIYIAIVATSMHVYDCDGSNPKQYDSIGLRYLRGSRHENPKARKGRKGKSGQKGLCVTWLDTRAVTIIFFIVLATQHLPVDGF